MVEFNALLGKILTKVEGCEKGKDEIIFTTDAGEKFMLYHMQDCCETVDIEDVEGDINDLIGIPLIVAEEVTETDSDDAYYSRTWTFYRLATNKGFVILRWLGVSNGYYSETVDFKRV